MIREIKEVLRLLRLMAKLNRKQGLDNSGGLLILVWTKNDLHGYSLNCTVAAAGPWSAGIQMEELHPVFTDLMNGLCACPGLCTEPDIEDLCAFTDAYGSLNVFLSFQMNNRDIVTPTWQHQIETFFQTFSWTNAEIEVYLKFKINKKHFQQEYRVKEYIKVHLSGKQPVFLDVSVKTHSLPEFSENGLRCHGSHPGIGDGIFLCIPPKAMEQGLMGTITLQFVSLLRPCALQYPNAGTNLSQIKVLMYSPSNVPVSNPAVFMQNLTAHLNCQELGLKSDCLSLKEVIPSGGTVYEVEQVDGLKTCEESSLFSIEQNLMLFLFLQHTDPFGTETADIMVTEMLLERHLEDILNHNKQAVTNAVINELKKTLIVQNNKKKDKEKMHSACDVILSSVLCIISCSSNMEFRNGCLNIMKVHNTRQLSVAISESLRRIIFYKFVPQRTCCSNQMKQQLENYNHMRMEL